MHAMVMVIWMGAATPAQAQAMQASAQPTTARHDIVQVEQIERQRTSGQVDRRSNDPPNSMR